MQFGKIISHVLNDIFIELFNNQGRLFMIIRFSHRFIQMRVCRHHTGASPVFSIGSLSTGAGLVDNVDYS